MRVRFPECQTQMCICLLSISWMKKPQAVSPLCPCSSVPSLHAWQSFLPILQARNRKKSWPFPSLQVYLYPILSPPILTLNLSEYQSLTLHPTVLVQPAQPCLNQKLLSDCYPWLVLSLSTPPSILLTEGCHKSPSVINLTLFTDLTNAGSSMPLYLVQGYSRLQSHWHTLLASHCQPTLLPG